MPEKANKSASPSFQRTQRKKAGSSSPTTTVQGHTPQSQRKANIQAGINAGVQTKLKVTAANDPSEAEADRMAERVVNKKSTPGFEGGNGASVGGNPGTVAKWSKIYEGDSSSSNSSPAPTVSTQSPVSQLMRKWNARGIQRAEQEDVDRVVEKEGMEAERTVSEEASPMRINRMEEEADRVVEKEGMEVDRMESEEVAPKAISRMEEEADRMVEKEGMDEEASRMESEEVAPMAVNRQEEEADRMESEEVAPMAVNRQEEEVDRMESEEVAPMSVNRQEEEADRMESEEVAPMAVNRQEEEADRMESEEVAPMAVNRQEEEADRMESEEVAPMAVNRQEEEADRMESEEVAPMAVNRQEEEADRMESEEVAPMAVNRQEEEADRMESEEVDAMAVNRQEEEADRMESEEVDAMAVNRQEESSPKPEGQDPRDGFTAPDQVHTQLKSRKGKGRPLPPNLRGEMEAGFGTSFEGVRIHDDRDSVQLNQALMARAFTYGKDIFFGQGEFRPNDNSGKFLIAHELTHTIQQGAVPQPGAQRMEEEASAQRMEEEASAQRMEEEASAQRMEEEASAQRMEEEAVGAQRMEEEASAQRMEEEASAQRMEEEASAQRMEEEASAQRMEEEASASRTEDDTVQAGFRDLIDELLDLADWVGIDVAGIIDNIPGYTLFSYVIEYDVIRGTRVEPNGRNLLRGLMGLIPLGNLVYEKLDEYGIIDKAFTWIEDTLSRLGLSVGRLESAISSAWNQMGVSEGISGNIRILQRHFEPIYDDVVEFASSAADALLELIKEALLVPLVGFLEENSPAYQLATKVLGRKFPLEDEVEAPTVEILRDFLILIGKETEVAEMEEKGTLQETADWIDTQLGTFFELLGRFQAIVDRIWSAFSLENLQNIPDVLTSVWEDFKTLFVDFLDFAAEVALKVLELIKNALLAYIASFADEIPGFHLVTVIIEKNPFTEEEVPRTTENLIRGFMSLVPGGEAKFQQLKESGVVPRAAERIDALVAELGISWGMIRDTFIGIWDSLSIDDLVDPIGAFQRIVAEFGEPVGRIISFVSQVVMIVIELILEMMNFPLDLIRQIIGNTAAAFDKIKRDPIAFLINLLDAVKLGFTQFFSNIVDHLVGGLQTWLFGELGTAGITVPMDLSFQSILGMSMEVLGITVDNVLERLALKIGQEKVDQIRSVLDTLTGIWAFVRDVIERGPIAIWEYIQEKISDLWNMILGAIQNWIMTRIVTAVTTKLLSMLDPTGVMAVINSFIAFYSAVQSFIEKLREILEIINTFVKGVLDIANGNIQNAANFLEQALSDGIPVAIAFLANQVGLGDLGSKISEMIELAREKINEGIDWLIDKALEAGTAFLEMMGLGGGEEGEAAEEETPQADTEGEDFWEAEEGFRGEDEEGHRLFFEGEGADATLMLASTPRSFQQFINNVDVDSSTEMADAKAEALTIAADITAIMFRAPDPNLTPGQNRRQKFIDISAQMDLMSPHLSVLLPDAPKGTYDDPIPVIWNKRGMIDTLTNLVPQSSKWTRRAGITAPDVVPSAPYRGVTALEIPPSKWGHFSSSRAGTGTRNGHDIEYINIGVDRRFVPSPGNKIQRKPQGQGRSDSEKNRFRNVLVNDWNYPLDGYDMDHVLDQGFMGPDDLPNLWPLYREMNQRFGTVVYDQVVAYSDDNDNIRLEKVKYLYEKWFIIERVGD